MNTGMLLSVLLNEVAVTYEGFDVFGSDDLIWSDCMLDPKDVRGHH